MSNILLHLSTLLLLLATAAQVFARRSRSLTVDPNQQATSPEFIWSTQTVAAGDTAVLHCSFDAIFSHLRIEGNEPTRIDWLKESRGQEKGSTGDGAQLLATGRKVAVTDKRYRVYRPHNSALSVLIIRRAKKKDSGIFRCNLSGSSTKHKYLVLNVTESKIEAQTSPARMKARAGKDAWLWCNATGYPKPMVYWTREDGHRKLPDGSVQFWGNGLEIAQATEEDNGIYACYLDNFVQPVVSYKFVFTVEERPWHIDAYKMRFDSSQWNVYNSDEPKPVQGKSFLLRCETRSTNPGVITPHITWYTDNKEIRNNRHFHRLDDMPEGRGAGLVSSTLVIIRFSSRFVGNYTCVVSMAQRVKKLTFSIPEFLPPDAQQSSGGKNDVTPPPRPTHVSVLPSRPTPPPSAGQAPLLPAAGGPVTGAKEENSINKETSDSDFGKPEDDEDYNEDDDDTGSAADAGDEV